MVVGGGPAGATAAADLARGGRSVLLLDRAGRIKPCGGAIPPICVREFGIPDSLIVARATGARIVAPSAKEADMPIDGEGYVGMVDRETFDEWLRERAAWRPAPPAAPARSSGSATTRTAWRWCISPGRTVPEQVRAPARWSARTGRGRSLPSSA